MTTGDELFDRLQRCPVGVWSTVELAPWGYRLTVRPDGTGLVLHYSGLGQERTLFDWRLGAGGELEVRLTIDGELDELDSKYIDWHASPYRLTSNTTPYTRRVVPAITFESGLLGDKTYMASILNEPLLYGGEPVA